jgi:hypothetical protein
MTNDQQRLKAYEIFYQEAIAAMNGLDARLEVLLEDSSMPKPGTRVEHKGNGMFGTVSANKHLPPTGEGYLWVAWETGKISPIHLDNLNVYL